MFFPYTDLNMRALAQNPREIASRMAGTPVPGGEHKNPISAFARAARGIWPEKTAANLAAVAHVSERAAKFWLAGDRHPSARAIRAIVDEITPLEK
jgi:hypothetical protein